MNKIIFLDFDGVLNSCDNSEVLTFLAMNDVELIRKHHTGMIFDERCVRWLQWIVDTTNCDIVISSSWRLHYALDELKDIWQKLNLPGNIVGFTPMLTAVEIDESGDVVRDFERGKEIQMWIDSNKPAKYCIIDDDYDMLPEQIFVQTDPEFGLTAETAKLVVEYLNS